MRIVLFCENKYAFDILHPIQQEALREGGNEVLWYVHRKKITDFPFVDCRWTHSMQEVYDFSPEVIFCPGNIVPYYLPGVKVQIFHGYAGEKKGHWIIRHYFDTYFTQGPHFTRGFEKLAAKYGDFEVLETGWPRQDWVKEHLHAFDADREALLAESGRSRLVLYAPTFSPSLTSLPVMRDALVRLVEERDVAVVIKLHPLTAPEWVESYKQLAEEHPQIFFRDDFSVAKYELMADVMISDTSSTIYEFLLKDKPVITVRASSKEIRWKDIQDPEELCAAFDQVQSDEEQIRQRRWVIENYDPYLDGEVSHRMLEGARDYIRRHGVPKQRKVNLWRRYTSIKTFGRIKK
ncbi:MAG: CDP-glycerol glycerophosphotransferase family protein [Rikenellaceae bacterium]|nr:CDP-glycerol glycerophosphotransferase family protein [Rikenellaceae bacterium]